MRCDYCPLADPEDVCPENEGKYGIEHKDGMLGCKHPRNWVEKRDREYSKYLGNMGTDLGIEHDFTGEKLSQLIETCNHMIGLDYKSPYHRHGKAFYKPYRNYFCTTKDDEIWTVLQNVGYAKCSEEHNGCVDFYLTRDGLDWLGEELDIKIYNEER